MRHVPCHLEWEKLILIEIFPFSNIPGGTLISPGASPAGEVAVIEVSLVFDQIHPCKNQSVLGSDMLCKMMIGSQSGLV